MLSRILSTAVLGLTLTAAPVLAGDVYVVHGIDGMDIGQAQELPVDVNVDGGSALTDFQYQNVVGPITLPTGEHTLDVRLSDGAGTGTLVATARVDLALFETAVIVAHLDAQGAITLSKFTVNNADLAAGTARFSVAHAAQASPVNVKANGVNGTKGRDKVDLLTNGSASFPATVGEGDYRFRIQVKGVPGQLVLNPVSISGNVLLVAIGSVETGSFNVLPVSIL